jgi:hypothetical protein
MKKNKDNRVNRVRRSKITDEVFISTLIKTNGFISQAAKILNVSTQAVYKRIQENPHIKSVVIDIQEQSLDFVENQLFKKIKDGELSAIIFYLKCKGKKRGYTERTTLEELIDKRDAKVQVEFIRVKNQQIIDGHPTESKFMQIEDKSDIPAAMRAKEYKDIIDI